MSDHTIIRKKITNKIVSKIPSHIKPVDYLSVSLDIAKESAYRRLRGEMSFAFDEIIKLSQELDFSIDELVGSRNFNPMTLNVQISQDAQQAFLLKFRNFKKEVDIRLEGEESDAIIALNYLPPTFCTHFEHLFKFSYYAWMHRKYKGMPKLYYADIIISDELETLRRELDISTLNVKNNTFIFDMNVFLSPLKEVCYFYRLGLINEAELELIKKDFHAMIDLTEQLVRTGGANPDTKYHHYISDFNIDGNSSYISFNRWSGDIVSSFDYHYFNTIVISDPEVCEAHRDWLESLKKYSTLITQSNEIFQEEYFDRQRGYVDNTGSGCL